jgi:hypothetical protein
MASENKENKYEKMAPNRCQGPIEILFVNFCCLLDEFGMQIPIGRGFTEP